MPQNISIYVICADEAEAKAFSEFRRNHGRTANRRGCHVYAQPTRWVTASAQKLRRLEADLADFRAALVVAR